MSNKGCNYYNTSDGKPHCKKTKQVKWIQDVIFQRKTVY